MQESARGPAPPEDRTARIYRLLFRLGVGLYLACFALGVAYALATRQRLPAIALNPLSQAQEHLARGDAQRAAQQYRMVIRIDRASYETPRQLAELLAAAGDLSGQIDYAESARQRLPRDPAVWRNLGWAYYNNRRFEEALAAFREALRLDGWDVHAQWSIAEVYLEQDRYLEAIEAYQRALLRDPRHAPSYNGLGIAHVLAGHRQEAIRHFEEAVRLNPQPDFVANLERARREGSAGP